MITFNDLCAHLLPPDEHLKLKALMIDEHRLILVAAMMAAKAICPDCWPPAARIHRSYQRPLADLPWAPTPSEMRRIQSQGSLRVAFPVLSLHSSRSVATFWA
jgi:hypothetical protein